MHGCSYSWVSTIVRETSAYQRMQSRNQTRGKPRSCTLPYNAVIAVAGHVNCIARKWVISNQPSLPVLSLLQSYKTKCLLLCAASSTMHLTLNTLQPLSLSLSRDIWNVKIICTYAYINIFLGRLDDLFLSQPWESVPCIGSIIVPRRESLSPRRNSNSPWAHERRRFARAPRFIFAARVTKFSYPFPSENSPYRFGSFSNRMF